MEDVSPFSTRGTSVKLTAIFCTIQLLVGHHVGFPVGYRTTGLSWWPNTGYIGLRGVKILGAKVINSYIYICHDYLNFYCLLFIRLIIPLSVSV